MELHTDWFVSILQSQCVRINNKFNSKNKVILEETMEYYILSHVQSFIKKLRKSIGQGQIIYLRLYRKFVK